MGDEQKEIVRLEAFWIDTWLRANYKHIETRFVIHDAVAREVRDLGADPPRAAKIVIIPLAELDHRCPPLAAAGE